MVDLVEVDQEGLVEVDQEGLVEVDQEGLVDQVDQVVVLHALMDLSQPA